MSTRMPMTVGNNEGTCNICGVSAFLTSDHVPPRGCTPATGKEIRHFTARIPREGPNAWLDSAGEKPRFSQSGLAYRTLCTRCNSGLLGTEYDPTLIKFSEEVRARLMSPIHLPRTISFPVDVQRIARSVWGHIAAQGVDRYLKGPHTDEWADWFVDLTKPVPEGAGFFYWLYPHKRIVLARDMGIGKVDMRGQEIRIPSSRIVWLLKFYPLAFAWVFPEDGFHYRLRNMTPMLRPGQPQIANLLLDMEGYPHEMTFEAPDDRIIMLMGKEAVTAVDRAYKGVVLKTR